MLGAVAVAAAVHEHLGWGWRHGRVVVVVLRVRMAVVLRVLAVVVRLPHLAQQPACKGWGGGAVAD